ncbi:ClpP/crotonase-like domain-containing protein [Neohortaea acidophila]|uniref:ClpP/crotonase-like domain-containing protein n=1 Tax=Neohortaea acidophila TaxID=245834 RepID=A0A6A6PIV0_9PEZI|nr:ClpP/crotonase-like domain-containing protein [Neohortaea acidophila]KAF2479641.1 ClpP/crotonase-like domain-containing protein [Neohortaea acidophila]
MQPSTTARLPHPPARPYSTSSPSEGEILVETVEHSPGHNVATVTFSNPRKLNIVNSPLLRQFITTCRQLSEDDNLRVVVLAGAPAAPPTDGGKPKPPSWIGGMDIREMHTMTSYETAKKFITLVHHACDAVRQVPVPVLAKVHGFSLGAGLEIMAGCDLKIATKASTFGMPEVKIGLPSVVEAALMPAQIGIGRARRLMYLAENISAETAERWGLIERVVEDEAALDAATAEWVDMIVAMGPKAIRSQKRLMQKWENTTAEQAVQAGVEALAASFADGGVEPREYMAKFLNRKR